MQQICCKFTGKHPCRSAILIKLFDDFTEIALRQECPPVNCKFIAYFQNTFSKNTSEGLLLAQNILIKVSSSCINP